MAYDQENTLFRKSGLSVFKKCPVGDKAAGSGQK